MSLLEIHPDARTTLADAGLTSADDFLRLPGEIVGGHPDRHVLRNTIGVLRCFLKKEHHVSWRDRLAHGWRGYGLVSKSTREGRLLRQLEAAGVGAPRALAFGESERRAFLLLREETGLSELRVYLNDHPLERLALADALGRELARMHAAGFQHRDLYSKHVLVGRDDDGWRFSFVDWQRGRRRRRLTWMQRLRDLAALDSTLAADLAGRRERMRCLHAYLAAQSPLVVRPRRVMRTLCRLSARLQRKRRIRELRQAPLAPGRQSLIWLDGEALVVTPLLQQHWQVTNPTPAWLQMPDTPNTKNCVERFELALNERAPWQLVRRWASRPWRWLVSWWRKPLFPAPEFEQAATIIRLERYGITAPRLLALGHRTLKPWQKYSFLLTQAPAGAMEFRAYLATASLSQQRHALREAGRLLRGIHEAGYAGTLRAVGSLAVQPDSGAVVLVSVEGLQRSRRSPATLARRDLARLQQLAGFSATDRVRFLLGYYGVDRLSGPTHQQVRRMAARTPRHARRERQAA